MYFAGRTPWTRPNDTGGTLPAPISRWDQTSPQKQVTEDRNTGAPQMTQIQNPALRVPASVWPLSVTLLALLFFTARVDRCPFCSGLLYTNCPKVIIKTPLFHTQKEKDLENKNYLRNHCLTYIFCLSFVSRTRVSAPGQQEACVFCAISTLTGDTW